MMRRLAIAALAVFLVLPANLAAAQGQASAVQGRVVDESGGALPGVTVVITHQGSGVFRQVVSNSDGSYFVARHHARRRRARGKRHRHGRGAARRHHVEADRRQHRPGRARRAADHEQGLDVRRRPDAGHSGRLVHGFILL
ncbi:MAG: hypothetical protein DMF93_15680 [Acidobacteria bacterium]|nr:MAG: hypothetical protein DMF93_15680 [Acidobacteriota bacterium]